MWIFVAVVVVVAVGALVAAALMRPGGDDTSVRSYHSALGTLEHLSQPERRVRRPEGRSRGTAPPGAPSSTVPPVAAQADEELADSAGPLVFDDARPRERYEPPPTETASARSRRAQRIALDSMDRRPRRGTGAVAVVIVLVTFAVLAYVGSRRSNPPAHASTTRTTAHAKSVTSPTVHRSEAGHSHARSGTSTTTSAPSQIVPVSSSSTGATATYPVGNASFTLLISATGPCWIDVTTVATGATLFTGTLQAGATQSVPANGATAVELGATGTTMTVDGTPVVFPTPLHTPFVATFQPATASATTPGTTPTTAAPSTAAPSTG
jgi:RodZ C-terminal domain